MPIEIRELVIKVTVQEGPQKKQTQSAEKISELKQEICQQLYDSLLAKINSYTYER